MSVSMGRPRPGPGAPLTVERERYLRLVAQGMSNVQACREVGVHRITGAPVAGRPEHGRQQRPGPLLPADRGPT